MGRTIEGGPLTEEKVIRIGTKSANLEYFNHVKELSMDVSHDRDRRGDMNDIALLHEELFHLRT